MKGMDWGPQSREPQVYSRNMIGTYLLESLCSLDGPSLFLGFLTSGAPPFQSLSRKPPSKWVQVAMTLMHPVVWGVCVCDPRHIWEKSSNQSKIHGITSGGKTRSPLTDYLIGAWIPTALHTPRPLSKLGSTDPENTLRKA